MGDLFDLFAVCGILVSVMPCLSLRLLVPFSILCHGNEFINIFDGLNDSNMLLNSFNFAVVLALNLYSFIVFLRERCLSCFFVYKWYKQHSSPYNRYFQQAAVWKKN